LDLLILDLNFLLPVVSSCWWLSSSAADPAPWFADWRVEKLPTKSQDGERQESAAAETERREKGSCGDFVISTNEAGRQSPFALFHGLGRLLARRWTALREVTGRMRRSDP